MERRFYWTEERIRFFSDAAEHGTFYRSLAALLSDRIRPGDHVLDAGCGLGYLSTELTKVCAQVTAVDLEPMAIDALKKRTRDLQTLRAVCADVFRIPLPYDVIVCCRFGSTAETLELFDRSGARELVLIRRQSPNRRFDISKEPHGRTAEETEAVLREQGRLFEARDVTLNLDQPFRSPTDAERFFRIYRSDPDAPQDERMLSTLEKTGDDAFPYRLPVSNAMRIFWIQKSNVRDCDRT